MSIPKEEKINMSTNAIYKMLEELTPQKGITEVIINGPDRVFVEKGGRIFNLDLKVSEVDISIFTKWASYINQTTCDEAHPILDGNLPDGSRINIIHPPYTRDSAAITIRRYLNSIKSFDTSPGIFGLSKEWMEFFKFAVKAKTNIIVSGGTGVGKTTLMNLLLQEIGEEERVITIEDTRELQFQLPNVVHLEAKLPIAVKGGGGKALSARDLLKNTLRMRPDRIIVGEVRGGEVFDMLQAMNTGHDGSMASVHSNSPGECLQRLESLYLLAGFEVPMISIRQQFSSGIDFIIQVGRDKAGKRLILEISEITGMEGPRLTMQKLAEYNGTKLAKTQLTPKCYKKLVEAGLPGNFFTKEF